MEKTYNGRVSIIVPIYQGKKYIPKLIKMAEMCQEKAQNQQGIELILSNDDPHEKIEESLFSDTITIHILNTEINRGIQAARIRPWKQQMVILSSFLIRTIFYIQIISTASYPT